MCHSSSPGLITWDASQSARPRSRWRPSSLRIDHRPAPTGARHHRRARSPDRLLHIVLIENLVAIPLLGQEKLAVVGEVHLAGVSGDERVEVGHVVAPLGPQDPAQSRWASSWRLPKVPETWIITLASGRSMAKLPTFDRTIRLTSPVRNRR